MSSSDASPLPLLRSPAAHGPARRNKVVGTTIGFEHPQPPFVGFIKELSPKQKRYVAVIIANIIVFVSLLVQFKSRELDSSSPSTIGSVVRISKPTPVAWQIVPLSSGVNTSNPYMHSILHNPKETSIVVNFNKNRTCIQPQLIGRLSGMSLSIIEWDYDNEQSKDDTVLVGHYNAPLRGTYFIEIIVTMCQRLTMDTDPRNVCLVDPQHHRLTHDNATINVAITRNKSTDIGIWYNVNSVRDISSIVPLHTRYQPHGCMNKKYLNHCKKITEIARYKPYRFIFSSQFSSGLTGKNETLCFGGASHASVLRTFSRQMGTNVHYIEFKYIRALNLGAAEKVIANCNQIVISIGQWDLGHPEGYPLLFHELKRELNRAMIEFVNPLRQANISVYFRNLL